MIFKKFKNIQIITERGVSGIGNETMLLAKKAEKINLKSILEIGTGTGFIPIYLSKCGLKCEASDINEIAINCAKRNANNNNTNIVFYISDLFENISKKYDLIIFNPPLGNTQSQFLNKQIEWIKSILPRGNQRVGNIAYKFVKKQRHVLIRRFLKSYQLFLNEEGSVLIHLHPSELELIKNYTYKIINEESGFKIVLLN